MKVGVWIEIPPGASWKYEGLTRLLQFLLSGMPEDSAETFILVLPPWVDDEDVSEYLSPLQPFQRKRVIVRRAPSAINFLLGRYAARVEYFKRKPREEFLESRRQRVGREVRRKRIVRRLVSSISILRENVFGYVLLALLMAALLVGAIAVLLIATPMIFVLAVLFGALSLAARLSGRDSLRKAVKDLGKLLLVPYKRAQQFFYSPTFLSRLLEFEFANMARKAGRRFRVDCWYVPHIGYPSARQLPSPKVYLFPDYVVHDFPSGFSANDLVAIRKTVFQNSRDADHIIAISEHAARRHVRNVVGIAEHKVTVSHHGFVDVSSEIADFLEFAPVEPSRRLRRAIKTKASLIKAESIIRIYVRKLMRQRTSDETLYENTILPYLLNHGFGDRPLLVISTQNRPYKNTLGVLRAVRDYNLKAEKPTLVVMTGDYGIDNPEQNPIGKYVRDNGLWFEVIALPRVPNRVHAALYHRADLAIHGSFYEGGTGTFVLNEAISVGTPTIVSRSLAHDEGYARFSSYQEFNFDPNSKSELMAQLERHLRAPETLALLQYEIADDLLRTRDWTAAYRQYISIFRSVLKSRSKVVFGSKPNNQTSIPMVRKEKTDVQR